MQKVKIINGTYKIRGKDVDLAGMVFPLVEGFKWGTKGSFITVDAKEVAGFPDRNIKIMVPDEDSFETVDSSVKTTQREETDEEVIDRLRERFDMLEDMTKASKKLSLIHI